MQYQSTLYKDYEMKKLTEEEFLAKQRAEDLAFIKWPPRWPNWPLLPVTRRVEGPSEPETATLMPSSLREEGYVLIFAAMFDQWPEDVVRKPFNSAEEVIDEGWRVDR